MLVDLVSGPWQASQSANPLIHQLTAHQVDSRAKRSTRIFLPPRAAHSSRGCSGSLQHLSLLRLMSLPHLFLFEQLTANIRPEPKV